MTTHVMAELTKRRAELVADAKAADSALERLLEDIDHMDGAMRTYDPAYRARKVSLSRARRVDLSRTALDVLRQASAPMTLRDLTLAVMERHGKDRTDGKAVAAQMNRMRTAMARQRKNGVVRSLAGPGQFVLWETTKETLA